MKSKAGVMSVSLRRHSQAMCVGGMCVAACALPPETKRCVDDERKERRLLLTLRAMRLTHTHTHRHADAHARRVFVCECVCEVKARKGNVTLSLSLSFLYIAYSLSLYMQGASLPCIYQRPLEYARTQALYTNACTHISHSHAYTRKQTVRASLRKERKSRLFTPTAKNARTHKLCVSLSILVAGENHAREHGARENDERRGGGEAARRIHVQNRTKRRRGRG